MGRPALAGTERYEIQNIWDKHRQIMRCLVQGMKHTEVAEYCHVTPQTVTNVMNSAICKRQMDLMRAEADLDAVAVQKHIQEISGIALQTLEELMLTGNDNTRLKAATDILDRAGHAAVKTIRTENTHTILNRDDIEEIKNRARNAGLIQKAREDAVDIEVEPEPQAE